MRRFQRRGVDRADQRRCRNHQGELREHLAAQPRHKGRGQKHRHQHQRDADDRREQLAHRLDRGVVARHPLFDVFRDALDDDDRVVDDDADRQDQREQSRQVDRVAERRHAGEGADDRDRNRRRRHQGRAQILQKHQDDDQHQHAGLPQRLVDLVDRVLDEDRRIVRNAVGQTGRKAARQILHFRRHDLGHVQRVGVRALIDRDAGGVLAVELEILRIGLRAQFDAGDVLDAHEAAALGRLVFYDDIAELAGVAQPRHDIDGVLELPDPSAPAACRPGRP